MKIGRSLPELAAEVQRQSKAKRDFVANTKTLAVLPQDGGLDVVLDGHGTFTVGDIAHGQIADHTKIPVQYYNRMRQESPELLANNVETWFKKYPAPRMLRMLDQRNRAFVSDAFRPLDNFDFSNVMLEACADRNLDVVSCEVTEKRLYIKAIDRQEFEVPVGYKMGDGSHKIFDVCCPVFIASNSEVGYGRLVLETGVYTKACTNLAWFADGGMKRTHLGARYKLAESMDVESIDQYLTAKTKQKSDEALWMQLRDVLRAGFQEEHLKRRAAQLATAAENRIVGGQIIKVVENTSTRFGLNEVEGASVLEHLIHGGNLSQYGLHAAVTRASQDVADYDRATELERLGGRIIELPRTEWQQLLEAA